MGIEATMMRDDPRNVAYFSGYEFSKQQLSTIQRINTATFQTIFMAGGLAGVANWIVAISFDVLLSDSSFRQVTKSNGVLLSETSGLEFCFEDSVLLLFHRFEWNLSVYPEWRLFTHCFSSLARTLKPDIDMKEVTFSAAIPIMTL